jgi:hypothetical protein
MSTMLTSRIRKLTIQTEAMRPAEMQRFRIRTEEMDSMGGAPDQRAI